MVKVQPASGRHILAVKMQPASGRHKPYIIRFSSGRHNAMDKVQQQLCITACSRCSSDADSTPSMEQVACNRDLIQYNVGLKTRMHRNAAKRL